MGDMTQDSSLESAAGALSLLGQLWHHEGRVPGDLRRVLDWVKTTLTRCAEAETPCLPALEAAAKLSHLICKEVGKRQADNSEVGVEVEEVAAVVGSVVEVSGCMPEYLEAPQCMLPVLQMLSDVCTSGKVFHGTDPESFRDAILAAEAPDVIVATISSPNATPQLLQEGRRALDALGIKQDNQGKSLYVQTCFSWLIPFS